MTHQQPSTHAERGPSARIRVANAPCSWGVVSGVEGGATGWLRVLDEMAATGYAGAELGDWGFMPDDPVLLRRELGARSLSMVGAFTPVRIADVADHAASAAIALRTARLLAAVTAATPDAGRPFVILAEDPGPASQRKEHAGRIQPEHSLSEEGWKAAADAVESIARAVLDQAGLRTVFHHHCGTNIETVGETLRLLEMTSPELVGLCLDTGHVAYAGGDPADLLRQARERVWLVHFKDCDAETSTRARSEGWDYVTAIRNGIFCGLGEGSVDHEGFYAELVSGGYEGWIVAENEAPPHRRPAIEGARMDREYFARLGL